MRIRVHGRRGAVIAATGVAALLSLGLVARAELGTPSADPAATQSPSSGNGDNNVAVAVGKDGKSVWAIRLKVITVNGPVVDPVNAAVAAASCTDCQTVAIAIEGVLVTGDVDVFQPVNVALALNTGCTNCQTLADAYQTVVGTAGRVRITGEGRRRIADLRQQLHELRKRGLTLAEIAAEVDRIAGEFAAVLRTEVVPIGGEPTQGASASAAAPASADSSPSAGASSEPTASASATASPTPSP